MPTIYHDEEEAVVSASKMRNRITFAWNLCFYFIYLYFFTYNQRLPFASGTGSPWHENSVYFITKVYKQKCPRACTAVLKEDSWLAAKLSASVDMSLMKMQREKKNAGHASSLY